MYMAKWYQANKEHHKEINQEGRARRGQDCAVIIEQYLGSHCCALCGEAEVAKLKFRPRVGQKLERRIDTYVLGKWGTGRLLADLARAELRCIECLRKGYTIQVRINEWDHWFKRLLENLGDEYLWLTVRGMAASMVKAGIFPTTFLDDLSHERNMRLDKLAATA